jgi:hypothetical protein
MIGSFFVHAAESADPHWFYVFAVEIGSAWHKVLRKFPPKNYNFGGHLALPQSLPMWIILSN